jgi:hypothetical protein
MRLLQGMAERPLMMAIAMSDWQEERSRCG